MVTQEAVLDMFGRWDADRIDPDTFLTHVPAMFQPVCLRKGPSGLLAQAELPAARAGASDVRAAERSQVSRPGTWEVMYGSASSQLAPRLL